MDGAADRAGAAWYNARGMELRMRTSSVVLLLVAAVGCGRAEPAPEATPAAKPAAAAGAAPTSPIVAGPPTPAPVTPVAPDALSALLPELPGWTRARTHGEMVPQPAPYSRAEAHYQRGDSTIEIVLADSGFHPHVVGPVTVFLGSGSNERTGNLERRTVTVRDASGSESWEPSARRGEIQLLVKQRFIVTATGRQIADLEPLRAAVRAVDLGRLAGLR